MVKKKRYFYVETKLTYIFFLFFVFVLFVKCQLTCGSTSAWWRIREPKLMGQFETPLRASGNKMVHFQLIFFLLRFYVLYMGNNLHLKKNKNKNLCYIFSFHEKNLIRLLFMYAETCISMNSLYFRSRCPFYERHYFFLPPSYRTDWWRTRIATGWFFLLLQSYHTRAFEEAIKNEDVPPATILKFRKATIIIRPWLLHKIQRVNIYVYVYIYGH